MKLPINSRRVGYVEEAWQDVDEDDNVIDPVNSSVAANDNKNDAHQLELRVVDVADASLEGK
uniref:Uncharacterized protein n=1 Tax=Oryza sativa subsp. japonica TaxID=39947 RepID=Q5Z4A9_ORYSJ|nr:hypothetical protein [Oryza sativa Japonica Group]BAD62423.1 hypothetical protein [Oryza sativa Japonica Group]